MNNQAKQKKTAVIIGAGPAGLTAAYELRSRTDIDVIVIERNPKYVGGISRTEEYQGNRMDLGGHRFFSKSDRVMKWWTHILPIRLDSDKSSDIAYQNSRRALTEGLHFSNSQTDLQVMLVRPRKTRIVYGGKFFAYPVEISFDTLRKLGIFKVIKIGLTYAQAMLWPKKPEVTLEDFFINRFGSELYKTFFKSYTEKVWGIACKDLSAEWGAQRIKGLSITRALVHALRKIFKIGPLSGKTVETSLIEQFLYPSRGPGQMWEVVTEKIRQMGGEIRMGTEVVGCTVAETDIKSVKVMHNGQEEEIETDYVFSTTDLCMLARMIAPVLSEKAQNIANGLPYRNFISVGLLLESKPKEDNEELKDTWIYIHEPDVLLGRVQFFHNWSPYMVKDPHTGWVGLEYFSSGKDKLWSMSDSELIELASRELQQVGVRQGIKVLGGHVIRESKAYPAYTGTYDRIAELRTELDKITNLFPIGRNGMHRYNNQDHSMLTAMTAVDNIISGRTNKDNLWSINADQEYHEERKA
ncbi:MAG TPA: NAD(P)/FAD-dependent oxidoreductase [Patescibacteria group bacterium]|nr:NAD(P)/FAD-dependent oxidoreductase [Patescibacteria group bacterium]